MGFQSDNYSLRNAASAASVTPHDTNNLAEPAYKGLYIGGTGNVRVLTTDGDDVIFNSVPVGILPVSVRRVFSTSTTATNIVALS